MQVTGDRVDEPAERLRLLVDDAEGLRVRDGTGVGTVRDDDPAPRVTLADAAVAEPSEGSVNAWVHVALDRPSGRQIRLVLATVPGEAVGRTTCPSR